MFLLKTDRPGLLSFKAASSPLNIAARGQHFIGLRSLHPAAAFACGVCSEGLLLSVAASAAHSHHVCCLTMATVMESGQVSGVGVESHGY